MSGTATGCDGSSWPAQRWRDPLDDDARWCARDREFPRCLAVCRESVFCLFFPLGSVCCLKIAARDYSSEFVVLSSSCWFLSGIWDSTETDPSSSCRAFLSDPISTNRPHSTHPHRHSLCELSKSWKKKCFWAFSELGPPWSTRCSLGRIVPCTGSLSLLRRELSTRLTLHFSFRFGFFWFSHLGMWALSLSLKFLPLNCTDCCCLSFL